MTQFGRALKAAALALITPGIIVGGIVGGFFTPTEASVIAVVYSAVLGGIIYRSLGLSEFSGVLEDTGLMTIVGEWLLRTACTQVCRWRDQIGERRRVSVNVSSVQFQNPSFVAMVHRVLHDTGVPPELIELELTESLLIANAEQARATLAALEALGLQIAIDDFGTGYSSLNYLRHFAVDCLKIDRSFITDIAGNPRDRAVASAIITLAKALDITGVAEGVETEAQASFFESVQCNELQGFLFSKPLPVDQLERYLTALPKGRGAAPAAGRDSRFGRLRET